MKDGLLNGASSILLPGKTYTASESFDLAKQAMDGGAMELSRIARIAPLNAMAFMVAAGCNIIATGAGGPKTREFLLALADAANAPAGPKGEAATARLNTALARLCNS